MGSFAVRAGITLLLAGGAYVLFHAAPAFATRTAVAESSRVEAAFERNVLGETEKLRRWTEAAHRAGPAIEERWKPVLQLLQGSRFAQQALAAKAAALDAAQGREEAALARLLKEAAKAAEERDWIHAAFKIARAGDTLDRTPAGKALRTQVLDGLLIDDGMVLIPESSDEARGERQEAFLVEAHPQRARVPFPEAQNIASSEGKRLPSAEEWDRMHEILQKRGPAWTFPYAEKIKVLPGLFEWVTGSDAEWKSLGYGICKGSGRPGVPATHPLLRKKEAAHADVGMRLAMSIGE